MIRMQILIQAPDDSSPVALQRICLFLLVWPPTQFTNFISFTLLPSSSTTSLLKGYGSNSSDRSPFIASSRSEFHAQQPKVQLFGLGVWTARFFLINFIEKQKGWLQWKSGCCNINWLHFFYFVFSCVWSHLVKRSFIISGWTLCLSHRFLMQRLKTTTLIIVFPARNNGRKSQHPFYWKMAIMRLLRCLPQDTGEVF